MNSTELGTNCDVRESNEWEIDWDKRLLIIHNSDPMATYRILIYANMVMLNSRFGEMQDKTKSDMSLDSQIRR